jgi:hypothetical protein
MALSTIQNAEKITVPDNAENTVEFASNVSKPGAMSTWWIEVIEGSIQFAADGEVTANHHLWGPGSKIPMTVYKTLHYKGATGLSESFVITV